LIRYGERRVIDRLSRSLTRTPPLDEAVWIQRHRGLRWLLAGQSAVVLGVCLVTQDAWLQPALTGLLLALCLAVASWRAIPRRVQQCAVAFGLFSVSAAVVRLSDGNVAAHFHYFVMLPFLALYEDGLPFAVGVGYVFLQHGLYGSIAPRRVYSAADEEGAQPWLWAGVHGLALLAASVALNIHWRASQRIRRSDRRSRRTAERYFERAGTMLVDLDLEGRVRNANPAACAVLGRACEEVVGREWFAVALRPEQLESSRALYAATVAGERPMAERYDNQVVRADGSERTVSWTGELLRTDSGRITGMLCSGMDVTVSRLAAEQLEQSRRDLASLRALAQAVARSDDGRQLVTDHVQALTGAAWVALVEPEDAATLCFTISTLGCPLLGQRIAAGGETSVIRDVFGTREERLISDVHADAAVSPRLLELVPDTRSIFYLPVDRVDDVAGVLVVGWHAVVTSVTERRAALVALAAHEAGIALERLESIRRLERIAVTDPLTELPNRRLWDHEIALALPAAARSGAPLAVAVLDLNDFKGVNDAEGHAAGDRLLLASARAWRDVLRAGDLLVRFGGDEFAVLLPDCPLEETGAVAARLKAAVPHRPGVSVGIGVWDGAESADALVRRADAALYADKAAARVPPVGSRPWT
jgi:diguanylate cyclase (GGDEF)-like protein/PAS domain S-box-containing protein